jgi:hypothetical protein
LELPLIFTILFESANFAVVLGVLKIGEETLLGLYRGLTYMESTFFRARRQFTRRGSRNYGDVGCGTDSVLCIH